MKAGESWLGVVKWYKDHTGVGCITADNGIDVPVHASGISGSGVKVLDEYQRVKFTLKDIDGQLEAVETEPVESGANPIDDE